MIARQANGGLWLLKAFDRWSTGMIMRNAQAGGNPEMPGASFFLNFFIGLAMMGHLVSVLLRTANIARTKVDVPNSAALVILTLIYMITLPILQSKLNKISHNPSQ
ncbi:MAG: hypothetical protein EA353_04610 [Puniceicoccaceae bacterium]|nr:MAG: hypothetical protein EA353_04610 [Puniceicoccaceae bacterium]